MNREIEFRGKHFYRGEWIYGDLIRYSEKEWLIMEPFYKNWDVLESGTKVNSDTIGQYSGLKDKNGVKIFEGDILNNSYEGKNALVTFAYGGFCCVYPPKNRAEEEGEPKFDTLGLYIVFNNSRGCNTEVIGNIHDSPELLEPTNET